MINTVSAKDIIEWVAIAFAVGFMVGAFVVLWMGSKHGWFEKDKS